MLLSLEISIVEALEALFNLGPLAAGGGDAVLRFALSFLQMMALRGPHLRRPVEHALAAFLRQQPQFCPHFLIVHMTKHSRQSSDQQQHQAPQAETFWGSESHFADCHQHGQQHDANDPVNPIEVHRGLVASSAV